MASFTAGTTFVDGVSNDVTAAKLGTLVTNATPTSGFIQDRTAETVVGTDDTILIGDASDSNNLKRMTVANILKAPLVSTSGTIDSLTTGTTTSTNQIVTNGTITNLSATTSTFLGAITGSTNVVNIGSGQIYKDASGLVGIGTTSPASKLHVLTPSPTSANEVARFQGGSNSSNFRNYISLYTTNPDYWWELSNQDASGGAAVNGLAFRERSSTYGTASIERLYIASGGNVGIGTTSPSTKLDVLCSPNAGIRVTDGTQVGIMYASGVGGIVAGTTSTHPYILYSNNTERLRIDSSGNVNIGSESVNTLRYLDITNGNTGANAGSIIRLVTSNVAGTGSVSTDIVKYKNGQFVIANGETNSAACTTFNVAGSERLRIDSSGNVGIGTTSPVYKFVVSSSGSQGIEINPTSSTLTDIYSYNRATSAYINSQINALNLIVSTGVSSSTERLRIDSSGNCSIGTATALSRLHVHGDLTLSNTTTSTTGATGGVSKPATYAGFLTVSINGTSRKIPYYA